MIVRRFVAGSKKKKNRKKREYSRSIPKGYFKIR